jgi:hypothetical protein
VPGLSYDVEEKNEISAPGVYRQKVNLRYQRNGVQSEASFELVENEVYLSNPYSRHRTSVGKSFRFYEGINGTPQEVLALESLIPLIDDLVKSGDEICVYKGIRSPYRVKLVTAAEFEKFIAVKLADNTPLDQRAGVISDLGQEGPP